MERRHISRDCRIPRKDNYGGGRWPNRGGRGRAGRGNRGRGNGNRSDHKANMTTLEENSSEPISESTAKFTGNSNQAFMSM